MLGDFGDRSAPAGDEGSFPLVPSISPIREAASGPKIPQEDSDLTLGTRPEEGFFPAIENEAENLATAAIIGMPQQIDGPLAIALHAAPPHGHDAGL